MHFMSKITMILSLYEKTIDDILIHLRHQSCHETCRPISFNMKLNSL